MYIELLLRLQVGLCINQDSWLQMAEANLGSLKQNENLLGEHWVEPSLK